MDKEVKQLVKNLIDDGQGPTMVYQLVSIIDVLQHSLHLTGMYEVEEEHYHEYTKKLIEASLIAKEYLDVYYEIIS